MKWLLACMILALVGYTGQVALADTSAQVTITATGYVVAATVPTVTTGAATADTCRTATFWGNITDDGNATITQRGFVYGSSCAGDPGNATAPAASAWDSYRLESGSFGNGTYSLGVEDLSGNETYFYAAAIWNGSYWDYGDCGNVTTPECGPCPPPTDLTVTVINDYKVEITWTPGAGIDGTIIRGAFDEYPADYNDGFAVYAGAGNSTTHYVDMEFLGADIMIGAWSMCDNVDFCCEDCGSADTYSSTCAQATISGGEAMSVLSESMALGVLLLFILAMVIASYKIDSMPLRITTFLACFALMPELYGHGYIFSIVAFLLGLAIVFVTMIDTIKHGPRV